jgi:hypothetical protein
VRSLLKRQGVRIAPQLHSGKTTFCCGEGGAVNCLKPTQSGNWTQKRVDEAAGIPIVSYCAGCTNILSEQTEANHILDIIFNNPGNKIKVANPPLTYFKRLKLKKKLQDNLPAAVTRERTFQPQQRKTSTDKNRMFILIVAGFLLILPGLFFWLH